MALMTFMTEVLALFYTTHMSDTAARIQYQQLKGQWIRCSVPTMDLSSSLDCNNIERSFISLHLTIFRPRKYLNLLNC